MTTRIAPVAGTFSVDFHALVAAVKQNRRMLFKTGVATYDLGPHVVVLEGVSGTTCGYVRQAPVHLTRQVSTGQSLLRLQFPEATRLKVDEVVVVDAWDSRVLRVLGKIEGQPVALAEMVDPIESADFRRVGAFTTGSERAAVVDRLEEILEELPTSLMPGVSVMPIHLPRDRGDRVRERVTVTVSKSGAPVVGLSAWRDSTFDRGAPLDEVIDAGFEVRPEGGLRTGMARVGDKFQTAKAGLTNKRMMRATAVLSSAGRPANRHLGVYVLTSLIRTDVDFRDPMQACLPYTMFVSPWSAPEIEYSSETETEAEPQSEAEEETAGVVAPEPESSAARAPAPAERERKRTSKSEPSAGSDHPVDTPTGSRSDDPSTGREAASVPTGASRPPATGPMLAIDFGTTFTSAAVRAGDGTITTVAFDDGHTRMPSGVLRTAGGLVVGSLADAQAAMDPEAFEPWPKRQIGRDTVRLGGEDVPVVDLVAAVLRHVANEVRRQHGDGLPVVLTHPAEWAKPRRAVLLEAARRAGLGESALVPEPVAAAAAYATDHSTAVGSRAAVYDLGGGTFDVAVVERTGSGWDVIGVPAGLDQLGGIDFDRCVFEYVGDIVKTRDPEVWTQLVSPPDITWRRHRRDFQREVRAAKEALSAHESWPLFVPGAGEMVTVTASELEELIEPLVEQTVNLLIGTIRQSGLAPEELDGIYLTGGSSRIPLVQRQVWDAIGIEPRTRSDPKLVVVTGAVS